MTESKPYSYSRYALQQFRKNKAALWSVYIMIGLLIVGFLSPFLANEKPLYIKYQQQIFFPAFTFKTYYTFKNENGKEEVQQIDLIKWNAFFQNK